jgi:hypothetical protein
MTAPRPSFSRPPPPRDVGAPSAWTSNRRAPTPPAPAVRSLFSVSPHVETRSDPPSSVGTAVVVTPLHRFIAGIRPISSSSTRYRTFPTHFSPQFRSTLLRYSVRITAGHRRLPLGRIRRPRFVSALLFTTVSIASTYSYCPRS